MCGFDKLYDDQDTARSLYTKRICGDKMWMVHFQVVVYIIEWLCFIQSCGTGCDCHAEERARLGRRNVECPWKSRRMAVAYTFAMEQLKRALREVDAWATRTLGCDEAFLSMVQGTVRGNYLLGERHVSYLDYIPYLLGRLEQPGVRDRARLQYRSAPREYHHRESIRLLDDASEFKEDIDAVSHDGRNLSARLLREVESIKHLPFNDGTMEGPHNLAKDAHANAPAPTWEWVAG